VTGIDLFTLAAVMDVVRGAIMTLFVISAFLVVVIVLAQEGKGGGLAGAFGGAGTETFGVKAGTVNTATAWVGAMFLGLALLYAGLSTASSAPVKGADSIESLPGDDAPEEPAKDADDTDEPAKDAGDSDPKDADPKDAEPKDADGEPKKDEDK